MWAGAVAEPLRSTSAGIASTISMARSVAVSFRRPLPASIKTLDRIGIVLRRSTTLWTWLSAFKKAPRSTVIFIGPALALDGLQNPRFGALLAARNPLIHLSFAEAVDSSKGVYQAGGKVNSSSAIFQDCGRTP